MTTHFEAVGAASTSPFPPSVHLGERETSVLFTVLDRVARSAGQDDAAAPAGERVARAGVSFRIRFDGRTCPQGGLAAAAAPIPSSPGPWPPAGLPPELRDHVAGPARLVSVPYDAVLDLAAELLEVADVLIDAGCSVEALALEGVSGRLLELVVDAGPYEGTPIGHRR